MEELNLFNYIDAEPNVSAGAERTHEQRASCQINKKLSSLSFPYGISSIQVEFANQKLRNQRDFLKRSNFLSSTGQTRSLFDVSMSANLSKRYYAEVTNRVNTMQSLVYNSDLRPIFLTITLNGCFRDAIKGDFSRFSAKDRKYLPFELKNKLNMNIPFTISDLVHYLNHCWNIFVKRLHTKYKNLDKSYIRTFEPHKKDGVPHIHALLNIPPYAFDYTFKIYQDIFYAPQNLKNNLLTSDQIKNGEIHGFQWTLSNPTGYVLKYINKTFINFDVDDELNEYSAWYVVNKVRRFITSKTDLPLWIYRKINSILPDFYALNYKLKNGDFVGEWSYDEKYFKIYNQDNDELIHYENSKFIYSVKKHIIAQYENKNSSPKYIDTLYRVDKIPTIKSKEQNTDKIPYKLLPTELKAFSKMTDFEMVNYYIDADKENMNVQRLAILENEMLKRNLNNFTSYNEKHNLNDILFLKNEFVERGLSYYEF